MSKYMVITNNPLVRSRLDDTHEVIYLELSYEELLKVVRDRIYEGHRLLTHPLSGSVKPKETPYKSVLISERKEKVDGESVRLIENAILYVRNFKIKVSITKKKFIRIFNWLTGLY